MEYYHTTTKARWIGEVEASDADAAIKQAAREFGIADLKKLIAVQRR
jgi:hypothetical protein